MKPPGILLGELHEVLLGRRDPLDVLGRDSTTVRRKRDDVVYWYLIQ
jgi:hypothetical protein